MKFRRQSTPTRKNHRRQQKRTPWARAHAADALARYRVLGAQQLEPRLVLAWDTAAFAIASSNVTQTTAAGTTTFTSTGSGAQVGFSDIVNALTGGDNVVINTGSTGTEAGNITDAAVQTVLAGLPSNLSIMFQTDPSATVGSVSLNALSFQGTGESIVIDAVGNVTTSSLDGNSSALSSLSITSTKGSVNASANLFATNLSISASTGIGSSGTPLTTETQNLGADTSTGGIFITNNASSPGALNVVGTDGVADSGASGDIQLINSGTIDSVTNGDTIRGPGNITVQALGTTADVNTGGQSADTSIRGTGSGTVTVKAGEDINLGNTTGFGSVRSVSGSISLNAGRNITMNANAVVNVIGGAGTINATAGSAGSGGNIDMQSSPGTLLGAPQFSTAGGAINLTTGAGGTFTAASTGTDAVASGNGNITISADAMTLGAGIDAGSGIATLQPATTGRAISLGTTVAGQLSLLQTDLNQVTAGILRIGIYPAGNITITAPITDATTGFTTLTLISNGGTVSQDPGDTLTVTNLQVGAPNVLLNENNVVSVLAGTSSAVFNFTDSTNLTVGTVDSGVIPGYNFGVGIDTLGAPVNLTVNTAGDSLTVNQPIDTTDSLHNFGPGGNPAGANVSLVADGMAVNTTINGGTGGTVTLQPFTTTEDTNLGTKVAGQLGLTNTELNEIAANTLQIGSSSYQGDISASAVISLPNIAALALDTTGGVTVGSGNGLEASNGSVAITAGGTTTIEGTVSAKAAPTVNGGSLEIDYTPGADLPQGLSFSSSAGGTLTISDVNGAAAHTYDVTSTDVTRDGAPSIAYSGLSTMFLEGDGAGNTFNFQSTHTGMQIGVEPGTGTNTVNVSSTAPTANGNGTLTGNLTGIQGIISVDDNGGSDTLNVSDYGGAASQTYAIQKFVNILGTFTEITASAAGAGVYYFNNGSQLQNLNLTGSSAGGNTYNVNLTTAANKTTVQDGDSLAGAGGSTFNITGANLSAANTFDGHGGSNAFNVTGSLTGSATLDIDGGTGTNSLSVPSGSVVTPTGPGSGTAGTSAASPANVVTSFSGIGNVTGGPSALNISTVALGVGNDGKADTIDLVLINGGTQLQVTVDGTVEGDFNVANISAIDVTGSGDDDTLLVDNSGGLIAAPISFTGGMGFDTLIVTGNAGAGVSTVYNDTGSDATGFSGNVTSTQGATTETIDFTGLSPTEYLTPTTSLTIDMAAGATVENIVTGPTSTGIDPILGTTAPTYQVNYGGAGEPINWRNATTVHVIGSTSADIITENLPTREDAGSPNQLTTLAIDGNGTTGGGITDEIDVLATPSGVTTNADDTKTNLNMRVDVGSTVGTFNNGSGTLANINGAVNATDSALINGGTGALFVDDSGGAGPDTATITSTAITVGSHPAIGYDSTINEAIEVALTAQADTCNVQSTNAGVAETVLLGNAGNDTYNVSSTAPAVNANGTLTGNLGGIKGLLDIRGNAGSNTLNVSDYSGPAGQTYAISTVVATITRISATGSANIEYNNGDPADIANVNLTGSSAGHNTYNIDNTTATTETTVEDGDSLAGAGGSTFNITGANLGAANTFDGNGGNNTFNVTNSLVASATLNINGGSGTNQLSVPSADFVTLTGPGSGKVGTTAGGDDVVTTFSNIADTLAAVGTVAISATEGTTFTSTALAVFTTSYTGNVAGNFSATIDWGDGTSSAGTVSGTGNGTLTVSGSHLYTDELAAGAASVVLSDNPPGAATATATGTANVADADVLKPVAATISATEGTTFAGTVATFTDTGYPGNSASDFSAVINWGDGTSSAGTVSGTGNGTLTVSGSHLYSDELASAPISVTLRDDAPGTATATATGTANVADADVLIAGTPAAFIVTQGAILSGTLATFTDTGYPGNSASDFTATINWGDGTSSSGTVSGTGNGTLTVSGTHLYTTPGADTVTIVLADDAPGTATATATAAVSVFALPFLAGVPGDGTSQTFVHNLYRELLGREPDSAGDSFWVNYLSEHNNAAGQAQAIQAFLNSPEYASHYITIVYQEVLGRLPDAAGLQFWSAKMGSPGTPGGATGSADEKAIVAAFFGSDEFFIKSGNTAQGWINALYEDILGRAPDASGAAFWANYLAASGDRNGIVNDLLSTPEAAHLVLDSFYPAPGGTSTHPLAAPGTAAGTGLTELAIITGGGWENLYLQGPYDSQPEGNDIFFNSLAGGAGWDEVQLLLLQTGHFYTNPNRPITH